ncbi:zinc ribbon domain-containing protein [Paenibacillus ginsengarvi]|uniref:Zinc ribbon domain-containing protein n=1 Tax=Paenibacillus ginsengarvi TaxID=400777 RepID=A0A3B0CV02_9BACL|nr:zinc ribbon domain-containing protein [Paenibacillus ginsengarvi]RKN86729.1 zinc ribbon domain-containing protein [Paenibacillus ginsengarvi]
MFNKTQRNFKNEMEKLRKEAESKDIYICPSCKAKNSESQKYCISCGTWLLSSAFPAQKVMKEKKRSSKFIIPIIVVVLVLIGSSQYSNSAKFNEMSIEDQYKVSQLVVERPIFKGPSATADFTALTDTNTPLEVAAVFYDGSGNRLGKATSLIGSQLVKGQTTTLSFQFEGATPKLSNLANVRIEVTSLTPLMLLERAANRAIPK